VALTVGTNGQVLSADSTQASGLKWVTPTNGTVTSVTGTLPVVVATGTTTPAISVNAATTSAQGVVQVGAGIAVSSGTISAAPAILGTNDNNTLTLRTNGNARITVDTAGNTGIGTTSPSSALTVAHTNNVATVLLGNPTSNGVNQTETISQAPAYTTDTPYS